MILLLSYMLLILTDYYYICEFLPLNMHMFIHTSIEIPIDMAYTPQVFPRSNQVQSCYINHVQSG